MLPFTLPLNRLYLEVKLSLPEWEWVIVLIAICNCFFAWSTPFSISSDTFRMRVIFDVGYECFATHQTSMSVHWLNCDKDYTGLNLLIMPWLPNAKIIYHCTFVHKLWWANNSYIPKEVAYLCLCSSVKTMFHDYIYGQCYYLVTKVI